LGAGEESHGRGCSGFEASSTASSVEHRGAEQQGRPREGARPPRGQTGRECRTFAEGGRSCDISGIAEASGRLTPPLVAYLEHHANQSLGLVADIVGRIAGMGGGRSPLLPIAVDLPFGVVPGAECIAGKPRGHPRLQDYAWSGPAVAFWRGGGPSASAGPSPSREPWRLGPRAAKIDTGLTRGWPQSCGLSLKHPLT
jgi:hypothetical protein